MKNLCLRKSLCVAFMLGISCISSISFAQTLDEALKLTKAEQYEAATTMYNQLISQTPSDGDNYFYLGENYLLDYYSDTISNDLVEFANQAKGVFQRGINADASNPLNYVGMAKVANYLGNATEAEDWRAQAKSYLQPYKKVNKKMIPPREEYALALAKIADSYLLDGKVDTTLAMPLIRQALTIDAENPEIYLIAGDIYIAVNDGSNAIQNYKNAEYYDPTSPQAEIKIGGIYVKGKSYSAAIPYFEQAIKIDPSFAPAYRDLGQLYWTTGRLADSKANYEKYLDLTQGNIPAKISYVNSLYYAKDYEEVIKNVEEIIAVDNSRAYLNRLIGYSYFDKEDPDYDQAYEYMLKLYNVLPADRLLWKDRHYMARILIKRNSDYVTKVNALNAEKDEAAKAELQKEIDAMDAELATAFENYNQVIEMRNNDPAIRRELATAYYNLHKYNEAAKMWEGLLDEDNATINQYMQIGRAYYTGGFDKQADSIFNIVVAKDPNYLSAYAYIARSASRMDPENTGKAIPQFERLLQVAKQDSVTNASEMMEAFTYLAYQDVQNNRTASARNYYDRMINLIPDNKNNAIRGYSGIASIETNQAIAEPELDGKLVYLNRAATNYNKILELDPQNASAQANLRWVQQYQTSIRNGINPNEIRGTVKDSAGNPIAFASIRVKDTAAENLASSKGEFRFEIPSTTAEVLIISANGYQTKEVTIGSTRRFNITLEK